MRFLTCHRGQLQGPLIFAVVGLVNGTYGLIGLGVGVAFVGYFTRDADDE